jgi:hypothetical protein
MLERLRSQIGTAGLIVAIVALVAALGGGAYAATGGGKATASAKAKQGKQGKTGKTGPAGPAGPAGSAGQAGAKGDTGPKGDTGAQGPQGEPGPRGEVGPTGPAGPTETTLPPGKTSTGDWAVTVAPEGFAAYTSISFPLKLSAVPTFHYVTQEEVELGTAPAECPGKYQIPAAEPGQFCMYLGESGIENILPPPPSSVGPLTSDHLSGITVEFDTETPSNGGLAQGSWAVTALETP